MTAHKDWTDARWGQFTYDPIPNVTLYRCGVCRATFDYPHEKAGHLATTHQARVQLIPGGLYQWSRA